MSLNSKTVQIPNTKFKDSNLFKIKFRKILHNNLKTKPMDFKDLIKQIADRAIKLKDNLHTEEATKNALIMPFLQALGYDIFNPLEVLPEFVCDIGTKKGEKIDYAILKDSQPIILIECKHWNQPLTLHDNQLLRYFHVSPAKFGILTNGIQYRFYTDLETPNKMDEKPFLEIDFNELRNTHIEELKKFHKSNFDIDFILSSASELKYTGQLKAEIAKEFISPSNELVSILTKRVYSGRVTSAILEQFTELVKKSISNHIHDIISERLKSALRTENAEADPEIQLKDTAEENPSKQSKIQTTDEELQAFYIIKAIVHSIIDPKRITYRDSQSYFAVFIDDNNRKPVCRIYLNSKTNKKVAFLDENKKEIAFKIDQIDELYKYADDLIAAVEKFASI